MDDLWGISMLMVQPEVDSSVLHPKHLSSGCTRVTKYPSWGVITLEDFFGVKISRNVHFLALYCLQTEFLDNVFVEDYTVKSTNHEANIVYRNKFKLLSL